MTIQELRTLGAIYLPNIQDGFDHYQSETYTLNAKQAFAFFDKQCHSNNYKHAYVDFYYYTFDKETQTKINTELTLEEVAYLQKNSPTMSNIADELIFPITEMLLQIVCKLNATSTLFSTIYFTNIPCTFWGNYNMEYIAFTQ